MPIYSTVHGVRTARQDHLIVALVRSEDELRRAAEVLKKTLKDVDDDAASGLLILSSRVPGLGLSEFADELELASAKIGIYLDDTPTQDASVERLVEVAEQQFELQHRMVHDLFIAR